ncbi:hypothetical protein HRbin22_00205 [Candidatus Thermoflexus japonica]|uniref:NnrS family protein n=1 Tax=Candidatus Thermoflexus japonica TaxID=2035417 RepID=A0A2H5Y3G0_9CHLR|nr:hypothetical protein HRbin22_00205 [Candidatus Thermoflexus japonica]
MRGEDTKRALTPKALMEIWIGALGCFILAGATGVLFRYGMLAGLPIGLMLGNLRHAHSHLMYFGWVTPALMAMIAWHLFGERIPAGMAWILRITLLAGLAAYIPFLLYGYQPVEWAGKRLPLATITAGLNILVWYAYGGAYFYLTRGVHHPARPWWDLGVFFLLLSSLGAWGRAVLAFRRVEDPFWTDATVHFFLNLFADGWLTPTMIGLAGAGNPDGFRSFPRWIWWALAVGTPGLFLLTVPPAGTPFGLRAVAGISGGIVTIALLAAVRNLFWVAPEGWRIPLVFLGLRALAELGLSVPVIASWALGAGLRIFYLHLLLLGFVTLGLMASARSIWGARAAPWFRAMSSAIGVLLLSLIPLTGLWPPAWGGRWTLQVAFIGALLPVAVALGMLGRILQELMIRTSGALPSPQKEAIP